MSSSLHLPQSKSKVKSSDLDESRSRANSLGPQSRSSYSHLDVSVIRKDLIQEDWV